MRSRVDQPKPEEIKMAIGDAGIAAGIIGRGVRDLAEQAERLPQSLRRLLVEQLAGAIDLGGGLDRLRPRSRRAAAHGRTVEAQAAQDGGRDALLKDEPVLRRFHVPVEPVGPHGEARGVGEFHRHPQDGACTPDGAVDDTVGRKLLRHGRDGRARVAVSKRDLTRGDAVAFGLLQSEDEFIRELIRKNDVLRSSRKGCQGQIRTAAPVPGRNRPPSASGSAGSPWGQAR